MYSKRILFAILSFVVLLTFCASANAAQTACTSATNVSNQDVLGFTLNSVAYNFVENYITPDYAGVSINNMSYAIYPNTAQTINSATGSYVQVTQINYLPIEKSINFILCSSPQGQNTYYIFNLSDNSYGYLYFGYFGTTLVLTSTSFGSVPTNVTISNVTSTTPAPTGGYTKIIALNISTTGNPQMISMTQKVPCYLSAATTSVYKLSGGTWTQITGQTFNSTACTVTFTAPNNADVGIFYGGAYATTATTTTTTVPATTTVPTTTTGPIYVTFTTVTYTSSTTTAAPTTTMTTPSTTLTTTSRSTTSIATTSAATTTIGLTATAILGDQIAMYIQSLPENPITLTVIVLIVILILYLLYRRTHRRKAEDQNDENYEVEPVQKKTAKTKKSKKSKKRQT